MTGLIGKKLPERDWSRLQPLGYIFVLTLVGFRELKELEQSPSLVLVDSITFHSTADRWNLLADILYRSESCFGGLMDGRVMNESFRETLWTGPFGRLE